MLRPEYLELIVGALALLFLEGLMVVALVTQRSRRHDTQARHSAILSVLPDTMFVQRIDGVYVDCHAPDQDPLAVKQQPIVGRHMRDVLPPSVVARFERQFERLRQEKEPGVLEFTSTQPDGLHYYEARVVPFAGDKVLSIVRDITGRKHVETALSESEGRYALATAAGRVGVWDWTVETGEIYVDPSLKALLGYEDREIRNHLDEWGRLVHPDDRALVMERAQACIDGTSNEYEVEHRMLHRDGSICWFLARGWAVRRHGVAVRIIGTDTDITERKRAEQALHDAQMELTRLSRLTALGEFAASIAHEVSQPLTAIMMNATTCLRWLDGASPDLTEVRGALWEVLEASQRAEEVIRRNRELFRHHTVEKAPVDVNDVIQDVATLAKTHLLGSHVTLATALGTSLPTIVADRLELQQVLLNLIVNAIDAMESVPPNFRRIEIASALAHVDGVQVSVRDRGIGLQGVDVSRMFAPSYTTKANGTGVGLSISRSIVEAHGGRLWAEPNEDRGATFFFTVPIQPANIPGAGVTWPSATASAV